VRGGDIGRHDGTGRIGVWTVALRYRAKDEVVDAAAEPESLGYSAPWFPGQAKGDEVFGAAATLLEATGHG
jgi:hypothetical protein